MFKFKKHMATDSKSLIIVESPSKIKTLKKFLGNQFIIEASVGHIRDLATKDLGVDIENDFAPTYVVSENKSKAFLESLVLPKSNGAIISIFDFISLKYFAINIPSPPLFPGPQTIKIFLN